LGQNAPFWENLGAKLKLSAPIISSVGNLHLPVGKNATSCPPLQLFLTHDAAAFCRTSNNNKGVGKINDYYTIDRPILMTKTN